ncbi:hypothetical protein ANN_20841 [Periplaneta americana]|uniref:Uncharacterized protein n=1 Tax=Periplaneta americana TaxID=6978 RepID=A0ABQ8SEU6_PERAM|nr:hypothetical protein ANN_20841 [Periplaneta americana]
MADLYECGNEPQVPKMLKSQQTSKWADNRQATNFECTLTPCDLNCGFLLTNSDVYYANQDFQTSKWADNRQATNFECTLTPCDLNCGFLLTNSDVYYANQDFQTSKWADNRQATNFECTLTPCDLNCGFLLTNSDVYYANQDFQRCLYCQPHSVIQYYLNRDLAFITDISEQLNKLNCRLQGRDQNIVDMYDAVKYFVRDRAYLLVFRTKAIRVRKIHLRTCFETVHIPATTGVTVRIAYPDFELWSRISCGGRKSTRNP